jgi:FkbM family methyltransferase
MKKVDKIISKNQPSDWFERITRECMSEYPINLININSDELVLDIGCNVGGFSEAFSEKFKNILAIDASLYNVEQYKSRHHHEILHRAVYSEDNMIVKLKKYVCNDGNDTCSGNFSIVDFFDFEKNQGWSTGEYEEVLTISLKTIMQKVINVGLLKIDVEGSEWDFLYQKDLKNIKYITGEFHNFLGKQKLCELFAWISKTHDEIFSTGDGEFCHFNKTWKLKQKFKND